MTQLWKLTRQDGTSYGGTQWGENVEYTASGEGELCGPGWLHAYTHPLLAVLLNPIHADIANPRLWEAEGDVGQTDHGLKVGCTRLRTIREVPLPVVTTEQRVRFAILCAKRVCTDTAWTAWADGWLAGTDRTKAAAWAAAWAEAAAEAEAEAWAAWAAWATARAAWATARAAWATARAAWATARAAADQPLDLAGIAEEACRT